LFGPQDISRIILVNLANDLFIDASHE
jgi:hypothetical protein